MVERVRRDLESDRRSHLRSVEWLTPGVVWAMDFMGYNLGMRGKVYLHNTQDLASRYKFLPMAGDYPVGEEVAGYLREKFDRYGAPLILKRDNEENMNHKAINEVLAESFVLPLNNPEYYAPYNGAIEESQREVKAVEPNSLTNLSLSSISLSICFAIFAILPSPSPRQWEPCQTSLTEKFSQRR